MSSYFKTLGESDPAEALAMAAYSDDPDHRLETGKLNMRYFGKHIQGKLMSKAVNLLFQELCKIIPST